MYFLLFIFFLSARAYYLTPIQKQYIKNILQNSNDPVVKQKVKTLLVSKYSLWAINKARYFQKQYKIRPKYIRSSELIQSSLLGLVKSMKHYEMMALKKKPIEHSRVEPIGDNNLYYEHVGPYYSFKYNDHQEIVFEELNKLTPRGKRVFLLTYDIHSLKKKRIAKQVAGLM